MRPVKQTVLNGHTYLCHPDHRNGLATKSQWTIPEAAEKNVFKRAIVLNWLLTKDGWGLHLDEAAAAYLGTSAKASGSLRQLFIAKFDGKAKVWHGYPADPQRRPTDTPPEVVLRAWLDLKYLRPQTVRKLLQGRPCNL